MEVIPGCSIALPGLPNEPGIIFPVRELPNDLAAGARIEPMGLPAIERFIGVLVVFRAIIVFVAVAGFTDVEAGVAVVAGSLVASTVATALESGSAAVAPPAVAGFTGTAAGFTGVAAGFTSVAVGLTGVAAGLAVGLNGGTGDFAGLNGGATGLRRAFWSRCCKVRGLNWVCVG
jgi:hypothetical protein